MPRVEEPLSIKPDLSRGHNTYTGELSINTLLTMVNTIRKREGFVRTDNAGISVNAVNGLYKYYKRNGESYIIRASNINIAWLDTSGEPDVWTIIHTSLTNGAQVHFCTAFNKLFSVNGNESPKEWDGTVAQDIQGIPLGWGDPFAPKYIAYYKQRLFFAANKISAGEYGSSLYYSNLGYKSSTADYKTINIIQALTDDNDILTGMIPQDDYLAIFKQNSIHKIVGSSPDDFQKPYDINQSIGAVAPRSIVSIGPYIFFLNKMGLFHYDGANVTPIPVSKSVDHEILNIPDNKLSGCCACYWRGYYLLAYPQSGGSYNDRMLCFNVFTGKAETFDVNSFGFGWSQWRGLNPSCFFVQNGVDDTDHILFGDSTGTGDFVYIYPSGLKDQPNSVDIAMQIRKRLPDIKPETREKELYGYQIRCKGFTGLPNFKILDDNFNLLESSSIEFPSATGTIFNNGTFDSIVLGGDPEWGRLYEMGLGTPKAKRFSFEIFDSKSGVFEIMDIDFLYGVVGKPTTMGKGGRLDQRPYTSEHAAD